MELLLENHDLETYIESIKKQFWKQTIFSLFSLCLIYLKNSIENNEDFANIFHDGLLLVGEEHTHGGDNGHKERSRKTYDSNQIFYSSCYLQSIISRFEKAY